MKIDGITCSSSYLLQLKSLKRREGQGEVNSSRSKGNVYMFVERHAADGGWSKLWVVSVRLRRDVVTVGIFVKG